MKVNKGVLSGILAILTACSANTKTDNDRETAAIFSSSQKEEVIAQGKEQGEKFPSQVFAYADPSGDGYVVVDTVRYYMKDSVFYTDRQYHTLNVFFSSDTDNSIVYTDWVAFDQKQKSDENGWYRVMVPDNFPEVRYPDAHISAVVLRSYFKGKPYKDVRRNADAYLYNTTKEIGRSSDRNEMDPEIKRLIDYINL